MLPISCPRGSYVYTFVITLLRIFFLQDRVFGKESKTIDLYDDFAKPVVRAVMEGINGMKDKRLDNIRMIQG